MAANDSTVEMFDPQNTKKKPQQPGNAGAAPHQSEADENKLHKDNLSGKKYRMGDLTTGHTPFSTSYNYPELTKIAEKYGVKTAASPYNVYFVCEDEEAKNRFGYAMLEAAGDAGVEKEKFKVFVVSKANREDSPRLPSSIREDAKTKPVLDVAKEQLYAMPEKKYNLFLQKLEERMQQKLQQEQQKPVQNDMSRVLEGVTLTVGKWFEVSSAAGSSVPVQAVTAGGTPVRSSRMVIDT